jgi:ATP-dependent Lhr-like helicase
MPDPAALPEPFAGWFARRGWTPHPHQLALLDRPSERAILLVAPTGGGKTLAGFLPSLVELGPTPPPGLHTLYVSPLKALAADIGRNLRAPLAEMGLSVRVEDRTGDTRPAVRARQRVDPPHLLLTTPESLALMLSYQEAPAIFASLSRVVVDEIHALAESRRGDQLALCLARLQALAPAMRRVGLSATVEDPPALAAFLGDDARLLVADPGPDPDIAILETEDPPPWAGQTATYAAPAVMQLIRGARTTIVFINTRAQAEVFFQALWAANDEALPIGLHHGSLAREARARVEAAMAGGALRAVVATGSLDLGIDWGDVDLVVQVGAPKNVKRLVQRIGRANHRYNAPSRAVLVPSNRFELLECRAALDAVRERSLDGEPRGPGPLDVLCQHILVVACAGLFDADALYAEVTTAGPYRGLSRGDFDDCLAFAATGGYALRAYDRWQRLVQRPDGRWQLRDPRRARAIRMNVGTIVDTEKLGVRIRGRGGAALGEVEEDFAATLVPGDTFLIGGETVRYESLREMTVEVSRQPSTHPKVAVYMGTKLATSTLLSHRVIGLLAGPAAWAGLPDPRRSACSSPAAWRPPASTRSASSPPTTRS